ncbi:WecB/TagA/CpsF family glycosyltransferase [Neomoorella mulderi]|uniref:N-acetylglucosaminyldiphosphoundecaprenol N-acetyl-beta-D-mannosaminyltransferase n=1 Tax=Moorella mulderi DSM 14980 TaxID=1122241 RepID=A0A151B131_9FIRM|nr:WecB/TagA/CpsF family glycosyltransferase [Moorella mulderi]KYH33596.1 putative N-acetylmannosaminyltransferase [Moorella mulderi DSM 14980]
MSSCYVLGNRVDPLTLAGAVARVTEFIRAGTPHHVVTLNAEIAYRAYCEPELQALINRAHLVTADGAGILWAARKLGTPLPERVTGIDLLQALAVAGARQGWRFYLYGAAPGVAEAAAARLQKEHPGLVVAGTSHGYLSSREIPGLIEAIKAARPHILLVGLGAPKQEYWIASHLEELQVPVAMGVGGSFDVLAGRVQRAPAWVQRLNLEWLYRVIQEPGRVKRTLALPKFMLVVLRQAHKRD